MVGLGELTNKGWLSEDWLIFTRLAQSTLANGNDRFGCKHTQIGEGDSA